MQAAHTTIVSGREPDFRTEDARWAALLARDPRADAWFVYAVQTTGVYCRPSGSARLPRRENVVFFDSADEAEAAGYRPSQRTVSDRTAAAARRAALVAAACRTIQESETQPALKQLAAQAGISPFHFHRLFKAETGITPKAYASACRARRLRAGLDTTGTITRAIHDAGFQSSSRFYDGATDMLGMRAREYRDGGRNAEIRFALGECSLGSILVAQSRRGICAILLGDDPETLARELQDRFPRAMLIGGDPDFERLVARVVGFVQAPALGLDLPLDVRGTAFQQRVWEALRRIPPGQTRSYAEIARAIGAPAAVRAVAGACASNLLAVAIPCHRVLRSDGSITGYRWGVARKEALLRREREK